MRKASSSRLARIEARVAMGVGSGRPSAVSVISCAPPMHSVTSWPVISKWMPPAIAALGVVDHLKKP